MKKPNDTVVFIVYALLLYLFIGMMVTVSDYFSFETDTGFLSQKQAYTGNQYWLTAFYVHVFSCFLCLLAGFTQFSEKFRLKQPLWHRRIGTFYVYNIVMINAPMGFILALYANGGLSSKLAFIILDLLWLFFTVMAVISIRRGEEARHRDYMIRSYALTLSALTFRLLKPLMLSLTGLDQEQVYRVDAWLAFTINLALAEMIITRKRLSLLSFKPDRAYQDKECNNK